MAATKFEFQHRFWIFVAMYVIAFGVARLDHLATITQLARWLHLAEASGDAPWNFVHVVILIGAGLVFLAAGLRTWGAAYLRTSVVHDTAQHSDRLVADGPYRHTRNPLYFAALPMAIGIGVLAPRAGFIFLVIANWIFVYRLIFREEEALRQSQGESYLAYCRAVPRFWPSLRPRLPASGNKPQWGQAFVGEIFVWLYGLTEVIIAITLSEQLAWILFLTGTFAAFVVMRVVRAVRRKSGQVTTDYRP